MTFKQDLSIPKFILNFLEMLLEISDIKVDQDRDIELTGLVGTC